MGRKIDDYDKPHIIGKKKEGGFSRGGRGKKGKSAGKIIIIALITAVLIFAVVFGVYLYGPFYFRLDKADFYTLTLTRADSLKDAEDASRAVSAAGGAGYILNDGDFLVAAFVYKSEGDAVAVLQRLGADFPEAGIKKYAFGLTRVKRAGDRAAEKELKKLLNYPLRLIDEVTGHVYRLDSFESGESAVMLKIEELKTVIKQKSEGATALAAGKASACYNAAAEFYQDAYDSLCQASRLTDPDKKLTHRLKSLACELVEKYWVLRQSL